MRGRNPSWMAQHLVAWNRKFQDMLDVPDEIIAQRHSFSDYIRYLANRGEYGADDDVEDQVRRLSAGAGQMRVLERVRPNGSVIEVRSNPVAGGGFVLIYADITVRKRNGAEIVAARDAAEQASRTIECRVPRTENRPGKVDPGREDGLTGSAHRRHRARDQEPA
jgi:PAS fold